MKKIITLSLFFLSISIFPQTYNDFAQEIFFGRSPSAKTEAMLLLRDLPDWIGTQLKNIFNQSFSAIDEAQADVFPSIFRIGVSNTTEYIDADAYKNSYLLGFTLGIEYQDLFNSNSRTAYKVGGELDIIDILFLRGGYHYETKINYNINYASRLEEFTYGAGLKLDFNQLFNNDFPLVLLFDFVSLEQPSFGQAPIDLDNFTTFNLIAGYRLNSN